MIATSIIEPMRQAALIEQINALMLHDEYLGRAPNGWRVYKIVGNFTINVCSGSLDAILGWLMEREL